MIIHALNLSEHIKIDTFYKKNQIKNQFLLYSNKLTNLITNKKIYNLITNIKDPKQTYNLLIDTTNKHKNINNNTALIINIIQTLNTNN